MKAVSLWQPWASFMAIDAKKNETRSRRTSYRGDLVIHAAKKIMPVEDLPDRVAYWLWHKRDELVPGALVQSAYEVYLLLPFGAAVAVVNVKDCLPTDNLFKSLPRPESETDLGDYSSGRFIWETDNARRLKTPLPMRGYQSMWTLDEAAEKQILSFL